jgi:Uncharacterized flagellar protein FlaG
MSPKNCWRRWNKPLSSGPAWKAANGRNLAWARANAPSGSDDSEEISLQKLQNLTEAVDSYMSSLGVNLKFSVDERTDIVQVEVRDPKTDKLIRKIPGDEMLALAASIENMVGLFLNKAL